MPPPISMNDRFLLAAVTDRLIYGNETEFSSADAHELHRILPYLPRRQRLLDFIPVQFKAGVQVTGSECKGYAAGVGDVTLRDGSDTWEFDSHGRRVVRAGQWKLARVGRDIQIEQVMSDDMDDMRTARLVFENGEPVALMLLLQRMFEIGSLCFGYGTFKPWKSPAV